MTTQQFLAFAIIAMLVVGGILTNTLQLHYATQRILAAMDRPLGDVR